MTVNIKENWWDKHRLIIVVGHFGSGKTEVAVNLALRLAEEGKSTALADLDIVDPYFRSRECADMFREKGIRLIASSKDFIDADIPAISPEVALLFDNKEIYGVLDVGGDPSGARVLARYRHKLKDNDVAVVCVVNANRPMTNTVDKAIEYIRNIELTSGMEINYIVNNTHFCERTVKEDILDGAEMAKEVSEKTGIPVVCHTGSRELIEELPDLEEPYFPIDIFMKKPWEM